MNSQELLLSLKMQQRMQFHVVLMALNCMEVCVCVCVRLSDPNFLLQAARPA
jgi:hypothetical protein